MQEEQREEIRKFLNEVVLWINNKETLCDNVYYKVLVPNDDLMHCVFALLGYSITFCLSKSYGFDRKTWIEIRYDLAWRAMKDENKRNRNSSR
jgi:hypothetical protein